MMMLIIILNYINLPLDKMADDLFKCIFVNDKFGILIKISLKFVPKSPFDNNLALLIIACSRIGDKPLSGVGVTKAPFVNFSVSKILDLSKVPLKSFESHSYLTGATAAELRRHLSNINVIFNS